MEVVVKAAILVGIIAVGYTIKRVGWVRSSDFKPLSTIALRVTLPCALAVGFDSFTLTPTLALLPVLGAGMNLALMAAGFLVGARTGGRAFGVLNVPSFNIGLFAIPYLSTFVGPQAIVYAAMFDVGNAIVAGGLAYGWGLALARGGPVTLAAVTRTMFTSPMLLPYLVLVALRAADVHLPGPVLQFAATVGGANTFIAMLMIGIGLEIVLPRHKYATAATLLGVRYTLTIAIAAGLWFVPGIDPGMKVVVAMLAVAPLAAMVGPFTSEAGLDVPTSTFMTSVSILIGIVAMPAVLTLLTPLTG